MFTTKECMHVLNDITGHLTFKNTKKQLRLETADKYEEKILALVLKMKLN